jgi:Fic family protein
MKNQDQIEEFLRESNAIEGVYDDDSLVQALEAWKFLIEQKKLTVGVILKTHKILMLNQNLLPSDKGYFRNVMVYIGGKPALNALHIRERMEHLVDNIEDAITNGRKETELWKEYICQDHHVQYEKIHPFIDGNGRTGRMFMNWERLQLGLPLLIIHVGEEQMEYYKWFQ